MPASDPIIIFDNETTNATSLEYTAEGENGTIDRFRQIRLDFTGVLGTAKIQLEALPTNSLTEWYTSASDYIEGTNYPTVLFQTPTTGKFRFVISNAGGGTNITCIKSFTDTNSIK